MTILIWKDFYENNLDKSWFISMRKMGPKRKVSYLLLEYNISSYFNWISSFTKCLGPKYLAKKNHKETSRASPHKDKKSSFMPIVVEIIYLRQCFKLWRALCNEPLIKNWSCGLKVFEIQHIICFMVREYPERSPKGL